MIKNNGIQPQATMLATLKQRCLEDPNVQAGMLYGSFALGEADEHSDLDVVLFVSESAFNTPDEQRAWLEGIAPVWLYCVNEFGVPNAIFDNLVRGEFHFEKATRMETVVRGWQGTWFPSLEAALIVDKTGNLTRLLQPLISEPPRHAQTAEEQQAIADRCCNWLVFGLHVLQRGELVRALEVLGMAHRHLLWLARINENSTIHWYIPSRAAEQELSPQALARFKRCTATCDETALWQAYTHAWMWLSDLCAGLPNVSLSPALHEKVQTLLMQQPI